MTPYDILDVPLDATDKAIRKSYLELVKKFPPDIAPHQFKKISKAYSQIKDEKSRLSYYLFDIENDDNSPLEVFLNYFREKGERKPLEHSLMKNFLNDCMDK